MHKSMVVKSKEHRAIIGVAAASILCICLSVYNGVFGLTAFMLNIVALFLFSPDEYIIALISLIPWAYVFKINGISTSLFSIIVIAVAIRYMMNNQSLERSFIGCLFLFAMSTVLQLKMDDKTMIVMFIKLVFNLVLLYKMCKSHRAGNVSIILMCFTLSVLIASCFAYFLPDKTVLYSRIRELGILVESKYPRFTGLQNDPNYYNASLIISMLALCYLYIKKQIGITFYPLSAALIYFGLITYSKSFLLLFVAWLVVVVYYALKNKRYILAGTLLGIGVLAVAYLFSGNVQTMNVLLNRFNDASGATSGRTNTWESFFEYIWNDPIVLLFGNGFGTLVLNEYASHNTYIDALYYFGVLGTVFLVGTIQRCFKQSRAATHDKFTYIFIAFMFAIYFFLSGITLCEFPFYLYFIFMFFNTGEYPKNDAKEALCL